MELDSDAVFCRGDTILHSKQHIGHHVYEHGNVQRRYGDVH